jgi:hypothetical protein
MRLGPANATLLVRTFSEGVASRAGHDLTIEVSDWSADYADGELELTADPASFVVRENGNGIKPLSDKDRRDIIANVTGKVLGTDPIVFRSTGPGTGTLTLVGTSRPARTRPSRPRRSSSRAIGESSPTRRCWVR